MMTGIIVSAVVYRHLGASRDLPVHIYIGGLIGAVLGAKIAYVVAELPFLVHQPNLWMNLLVGRTILGGLLGGYLGVECGKRAVGYQQPTGDAFAIICPLGLVFGRIGCYLHGCCLGARCEAAWYSITDIAGTPRYAGPLIEALFNLCFAAIAYLLYRRRVLPGQLFHVYLAAYGIFRLVHEFYRATPRYADGISPYQILAVALVAFAMWRFHLRWRSVPRPTRAECG